MAEEIILSDNEGNSNILEYVEITNSNTGILDPAKDMVILSDYNPNVPVIRPPFTAENVANKRNNLINPNTSGYTSTLAVYNAIQEATSGLSSSWNNIVNKPNWLSGTTLNRFQLDHTHNYNNLNNLPNLFTGNTFIQSGGTIITKINDNVIIYSPTGITGNYAPLDSYISHTGNTNIHYLQSAITITENQVTNLINDLNNKSNTGHTHTQYLETSIYNNYTGVTIPNTYYNKNEINNYSGVTIPNNYYNKSEVNLLISGATSGLTSSWLDITDKPSWLSGNTLNEFESGHTHNQYLNISVFNSYSAITNTIIFYDCTVGTGGQYATINDAYTAGKRKLLVNNNTSLSGDLIVDDNLYIYLDDYTLSATTYNFTISSGKILTIEGIGTIRFAYSSEKILFNGNVNVTGKGNSNKTLTIINSSTATNCRIADVGNFTNLIVNCPNYSYVGFGKSGGEFVGKLDNIIINSAGSSCIPVYSLTLGSMLTKCTITGAFNTVACYMMSNIYASAAGIIYCNEGNNIYGATSTLRTLYGISNFYCSLISQSTNYASYTNGVVASNLSITAIGIYFNNVRFTGTLTTNNDYSKFVQCTVTGLLTLSSGAEYNVIQGNTLTGGLTNNSGNLTNLIRDNI